ncbi:DUF7344 domain-containing protein [Halopelagius longus]|uniref:DUF7344 domain-containing protein n=1 Tax=Halopelagius longus TaxID=1236180 RepID=A0A1H1GEL0_9EURY|nr:hypothetical protein [Halopelagius longus]RDI69633.1 hypothetical protein DWB78_17830 [Halopelagius longus]SDR11722.1 hypothetical protein SAMN05216278_3627 [Halopelagius longus]
MSVHPPRSDSESPPTWDTLFEVLSSSRRRRLLAALYDEPETRVSRVADRIAAAEGERSVGKLTPEEATSLRASLHHVHLPALQEAGLVSWDRRARTVSLRLEARKLPIFESFDRPLVSVRGAVAEVRTDV